MMDQKAKFTPKGIVTEFVGEEQNDFGVIRKVVNGDIQLVYISPESLIYNQLYRNMLLSLVYREKMVALVVDEVHCVRTWGDDFRMAYAHIGDLRSILPSSVNIMALTATATEITFKAVCERLSPLL
jgi:bloom syndrome protein